jgi:hypothetical protein
MARRGMVEWVNPRRWIARVCPGGEGRDPVDAVCDGKGVPDAPMMAARPPRVLAVALSRVGRVSSLLRARSSSRRHLLVAAGMWSASRQALVGKMMVKTDALCSCNAPYPRESSIRRLVACTCGIESLGFARPGLAVTGGAIAPPWKLLREEANMGRANLSVGHSGSLFADLFSIVDQTCPRSDDLCGCWGLLGPLRGPHGRYNMQPGSLGLSPCSSMLRRLCLPLAPRFWSWSGMGVIRDFR